ncbi:hypothetical protein ACR6HW_09580 [Fusibacter sp. JL298sf-3]
MQPKAGVKASKHAVLENRLCRKYRRHAPHRRPLVHTPGKRGEGNFGAMRKAGEPLSTKGLCDAGHLLYWVQKW